MLSVMGEAPLESVGHVALDAENPEVLLLSAVDELRVEPVVQLKLFAEQVAGICQLVTDGGQTRPVYVAQLESEGEQAAVLLLLVGEGNAA